jgi:hypothetical protein
MCSVSAIVTRSFDARVTGEMEPDDAGLREGANR